MLREVGYEDANENEAGMVSCGRDEVGECLHGEAEVNEEAWLVCFVALVLLKLGE